MSVCVVIREQEAALQLKGIGLRIADDWSVLQHGCSFHVVSLGADFREVFVAEVHQEGYGNTPLMMPLIGSGLAEKNLKLGVTDQEFAGNTKQESGGDLA